MLKEGQTYTVCWLVEPDESIPLVDFIIGLKLIKSEFAAAAVAHLRRAQHPGNHGEPLTKAFRGSMKGILEIRAKTPQGYIRMPFVFEKDRTIIVLGGVIKKGKSLEAKVEKSFQRANTRLVNEEASYEAIDFSNFD